MSDENMYGSSADALSAAQSETTAKPIDCTCIEEIDAKLGDYKSGVTCTLFGRPRRAVIETHSTVDNRRGVPRAPKVLASFCPFCGVSYTKAEPR